MEASAEVLLKVDEVHFVLLPITAEDVTVLPASSRVKVTVKILAEPSGGSLSEP
jgi:hypothetical protein